MDSKKVLYFGLGIGAVLLYMKYMKDKKLKADDIINKAVNPTTSMTSSSAATNPSMGIIATTTEKIKAAFGKGVMTIDDLTNGGISRPLPPRQRSNRPVETLVAIPNRAKGGGTPSLEYTYANGGAQSAMNTSISKACKCAAKTKTNETGILKNFNP